MDGLGLKCIDETAVHGIPDIWEINAKGIFILWYHIWKSLSHAEQGPGFLIFNF